MNTVELIGFNQPYSLTNNGKVFNTKTGRELKFHKARGYYYVRLRKNKSDEAFYVHRMIALNFLVRVEGLNEVNHINGIKTDNRVENLEWISKSGNILHYMKLITHLKKKKLKLENEIEVLKKERAILLQTG